MPEQQIVNIQQGIWIDSTLLKKADLGSHFQVVVQTGEIRIVKASPKIESSNGGEKGWEVFLSLLADASPGKLLNASVNHDRYLYLETQ